MLLEFAGKIIIRVHGLLAKEAYQATNKKEYVRQMMVWLGRQEAVAQFKAYLDYVITLDPSHCVLPPDAPDEELDDLDNEVEIPAHTNPLP